MTNSARKPVKVKGHDAMHRAQNSQTHPTHACSEEIRRFPSGRIARSAVHLPQNGGFPLFTERARRALGRLQC